ncbi:hypothetical protein ACWT_3596 [Actinoplanes sp. SE50]|uniref:hypothetical protein n=1 Tax=unclassified Actinoplanes TaxID=2626549 RepID=UPI00023EC2AB|nr:MULTISPECIES: hypothetical protein [unclassified Actinoplanes]AEV84619.1 hypothetical protein ACPL_3724 [Actinoplanes sp. SE50/110]ATO83011.1 hypothetical protein ACWT_3596 [Actinoplanes sp. SE50]SLM00419.1 hypothetical protein ACSP50_3651 [Actinoplanes sp. SE50/110]
MIVVVRSELYRSVSILSSWLALIGFALMAALVGWFSKEAWSLFAGLGAFGIAVTVTAQHYQHRTIVPVYLSHPHRWRVLIAQCVSAAVLGILLTAVSGLPVLLDGHAAQYRSTVLVAPVMAVFGTLCTAVLRHPMWLLGGVFAWLLFAEGLINRMAIGLPFASFAMASGGNVKALLYLLAWTGAAIPPAVWAIHRDVASD